MKRLLIVCRFNWKFYWAVSHVTFRYIRLPLCWSRHFRKSLNKNLTVHHSRSGYPLTAGSLHGILRNFFFISIKTMPFNSFTPHHAPLKSLMQRKSAMTVQMCATLRSMLRWPKKSLTNFFWTKWSIHFPLKHEKILKSNRSVLCSSCLRPLRQSIYFSTRLVNKTVAVMWKVVRHF